MTISMTVTTPTTEPPAPPPARDRATVATRLGIFIAACALGVAGYQVWTIKDNAQRQLRAYVFVSERFIKIDEATDALRVNILVKNFGLTPARDVTIAPCVAIRDIPPSSSLNDYLLDITISKSIITPGGDVRRRGPYFCDDPPPDPDATPRNLTTDERAEIKSGKKAIYVYGEIRYKDVFDKDRWTRYRFFTNDKFGMLVGNSATPSEGNDYY